MQSLTLIAALVLLQAPPAHAASTGRNVVVRSCERLLFRSHARASDAFQAKAVALLEAGEVSLEDARWIGENALTYPEIAFAAARRNIVSRLHLLMQTPDRAEVFFRANAANVLFISDLIHVADYVRPEAYGFLKEPLENLTGTSAWTLGRRYPGFDVVNAQASAMVIARWADLRSEKLVRAAERFVNPPRRQWLVHRWNEWTSKTVNPYSYRAGTSANFLRLMMKKGGVPEDLVDRLVASASDTHHPNLSDIWDSFAVGGLKPAHVERLREAWQGIGLDERTRRWIKHGSPELVALLDQRRSNATR